MDFVILSYGDVTRMHLSCHSLLTSKLHQRKTLEQWKMYRTSAPLHGGSSEVQNFELMTLYRRLLVRDHDNLDTASKIS
ncbi:hypothetical protein TNCV_1228171 [Trichonephila clavipes]|nr:hypothetical protein TNCV_1228171 [Trichonephila clavipes]